MYQVINRSGKYEVVEISCIVATEGKQTAFFNKADAENFADYLQNGLKVVRQQGRIYYFNSGDKLTDVTHSENSERKFILRTRNGKTVTAERLLRKYVKLIAV